ncbi:MAG: chemotaxis protein CheD [Planctomycetota bacterium]|nr:chemotaxis protein CheD [Planctomycetota bacterium]
MQRTVGISDIYVSQDPEDVIVTYSLGSCVGVTMYDPRAKVGGLVHCMLPLSKDNPDKASANPAMFVDTGVSLLLQKVYDLGARRENLEVKVAGGASPLKDVTVFQIGQRNYTVLRKLLWKNNILIANEEVGGAVPRTMYLYMKDGRTEIGSGGKTHVL